MKKILTTAFTLTGTIIGAGILGLPYVFSQSGFLVGLFWLITLGAIMILVYLYASEVSLRTKGQHQLPGLARKYLGKKGEYLMVFAMLFGLYSSLLAYLIGEGESFSQLFLGTLDHSLTFTLIFWAILTILLTGGLERLKRVETIGVIAIIVIIIGIFFSFLPNIETANLTAINSTKLFLPLGVTLFALLGFTSIPELREEIRGEEKKLKWAIIIGGLIPIIIYILFTISFVGILGTQVTEIATLSFGPLIVILGIFTMLTSYFVLSFSIKDMCIYDLELKKKTTFFLTSVVPILLFLFLHLIKWDDFITIIGISGVISGGLMGILIVFMNYKSKRMKGRTPEYTIYINKFIVAVITLIFVFGVIHLLYTL